MGVIVSGKQYSDKIEGFLNKTEKKVETYSDYAYRHLVKADALRIKNYFWEAIDEYMIVIRFDRDNIEAYTGMGLAYKQIGCAKNAIAAFKAAKNLNAFDSNIHFELGCSYCIGQDYPSAINSYKNALKLNPDYFEAKYNLAFTYDLNDQSDLALEGYKKVLEANPEYVKAYDNIGSLYIKLEDYKESIRMFKKLLKVDPEYPRGFLGIAICSDKLNNRTKALRYYKKYLKIRSNSDNLPFILERIAELSKDKKASGNPNLMLVS